MSAILNNVLKPWGFDSNEFLGSLRPEQRRENKCPQGSEKHRLVTTSLGEPEGCASVLLRQPCVFSKGHHLEALPLSHNSRI